MPSETQCTTQSVMQSFTAALTRGENFLHERFEARVAAQIIKHWIGLKHKSIASTFAVRSFQFVNRLLLVAQGQIQQGKTVGMNVARLRRVTQSSEDFLSFLPLACPRMRLSKQREAEWIVVELDGFAIFSNPLVKPTLQLQCFAKAPVGVIKPRIHFDGLAQLLDGFVVLARQRVNVS